MQRKAAKILFILGLRYPVYQKQDSDIFLAHHNNKLNQYVVKNQNTFDLSMGTGTAQYTYVQKNDKKMCQQILNIYLFE